MVLAVLVLAFVSHPYSLGSSYNRGLVPSGTLSGFSGGSWSDWAYGGPRIPTGLKVQDGVVHSRGVISHFFYGLIRKGPVFLLEWLVSGSLVLQPAIQMLTGWMWVHVAWRVCSQESFFWPNIFWLLQLQPVYMHSEYLSPATGMFYLVV